MEVDRQDRQGRAFLAGAGQVGALWHHSPGLVVVGEVLIQTFRHSGV